MKEKIRQFLSREGVGRIISRKLLKRDGSAGITDTVNMIKAIVKICKTSPGIRTEAVRVIASMPKRRGPIGDADAIFRWLKSKVNYVPDIDGMEVLQTPRYTMKYGGGDCDDLSILLATYLGAVGGKVGFRIAGRGPGWSHIYCIHWTGKGWRPLDLTLKAPGVENRKKYSKFKDFV